MDLILSIPAAIGLGALHSLEPGHGKGVISAYLIATRGKTRDAVLLGLVSSITHTFSIVILSVAATSAIKLLAPDSLTRWLELLSGVLITIIGARILYRHVRPRMVSIGKLSANHDAIHEHHHHEHHHHHHHHQEKPSSLAGIVTVGLLTGLIPCPSAMAIFLASLTADQISLGLVLVSAFSLGSAVTMSMIGILIVHAGKTVKMMDRIGFVRSLNLLSSLLILGLGVAVTFQALLPLHA
ncbi:sulfite exporter TauE/SafE family protein [Paenibacillus sp. GP183]|uniref:HoxN/HupN/NixA family nickel/cobalt transporter n=1 Tax=Paenibacillus sp. GP183 TaxID=1882751 RepID=UPI000894207B|nr:sulfite exporter TauE/SafE family protein [Paenibacillus sp. GP183]SEB61546.1 ABC-type nickel/cobalt efflux system, permease component RcnA [Paenibacillus sp. GP183]